MLTAYISRLSAIADNKINCGPALTWMEVSVSILWQNNPQVAYFRLLWQHRVAPSLNPILCPKSPVATCPSPAFYIHNVSFNWFNSNDFTGCLIQNNPILRHLLNIRKYHIHSHVPSYILLVMTKIKDDWLNPSRHALSHKLFACSFPSSCISFLLMSHLCLHLTWPMIAILQHHISKNTILQQSFNV